MSNSNKVLVVPMMIQLHLTGTQGHRIIGTPPWVDQEKLGQWGNAAEAVLRKHAVARGIHLAFLPDRQIAAHYCEDKGMTAEINTEVSACTEVLVDALLTDRETADAYTPDLVIRVAILV